MVKINSRAGGTSRREKKSKSRHEWRRRLASNRWKAGRGTKRRGEEEGEDRCRASESARMNGEKERKKV